MDTVDVNEITKEIDGVYKNILDNFNPASRQMIATGKAFLKSLHGASAASGLYLESMVRLSKQAQQSSLGNSGDIGTSLMQITEVFKEIHTQQLNTLKAFYVDFLVPLETNLEKDTRVIQNEQKKFLVSHKQRVDSFNKAAANVRKMKKKCKRSSSSAIDKEIKVMQSLEEERAKLEAFCEKSMQEALTQERRRYGFILERQASLAKHYLAFYSKGNSLLSQKQEMWMNIAKSRETLPEFMQNKLLKRIHGTEEDCIYCCPRRAADDSDTASVCSQLRKAKSMDASEIINLQSQPDLPITSAGSLSRAKSDLNLLMNGMNVSDHNSSDTRPKSIAVATEVNMVNPSFAKALYAYLSSGENQLSFHEGDTIALIGERNKGWQFGENVRTQKTGWFPVAYTELDLDETNDGKLSPSPVPPPMPPPPPAVVNSGNNMYLQEEDTSTWRVQKKKLNANNMHTHTHRAPDNPANSRGVKSPGAPAANLLIPTSGGRASDSLHSSNDSGFSNDLGHNGQAPTPPQPDVDYSDDEPNLSNSETKPGEKWLMDRYHNSESVRLGSNRKRSLSFNNVSGAEIRNRIQSHAYNYNYPNSKEGPLKKFLNRTKSLIFKRTVDDKIDSISVASSMSDLWGSHDSIVRLSDLQRKENALNSLEPVDSNSNSNSSNTINAHNTSDYQKVVSIKEDSLPPPIPPPLPSREEFQQLRKNMNSNSNSNSNKNTTSSSSSPIKDSESCIVIKDHTRPKLYRHDESRDYHEHEQTSKVVAKQKPPPMKKIISLDVDISEAQIIKEERERKCKSGKHTNVGRMESFGCSEAPIVPMNHRRSNNPSSKKSTQGSVSSRKPDTIRSGRSAAFGRSYIVESHKSNRCRYDTINSYSDNLEEEEDDQVDDFDDEEDDDDYEDNSSVFAEQIVEDKKASSKLNKDKIGKKESEDTIDTLKMRRHGGYKKGDVSKLKSQSLRIVSANATGNMSSNSGKQLAVYREGGCYENPSELSSFVPKISKVNAEITEYNANPRITRGKSVGSIKTQKSRPTHFKGSIRSEVHTVELIANTDTDDDKPVFDYGRHIHRRLYYPERTSKFDQKSERTGNLCGPWYDLWGIDPSVSLG